MAVLLVFLGGLQDPASREVAEMIRRLDSDEFAVRESAQASLAKMGRPVRPLLLSALSTCPAEARARIDAVLHGFILLDEEEFTLRHLAGEIPFPPSARREFGYETGESISVVLSRITRDYGIKVAYFPGDEALGLDASNRVLRTNVQMSRASAKGAIDATIVDLEVLPVVDGDRVVLVRITPAVLFEGLRRAPPDESFGSSLERVRLGEEYWDRYPNRFRAFLQNRVSSGGDCRSRWLAILKGTALDPAAVLETRRVAVQALQCCYLMDEQPHPDSTDFLVEISAAGAMPVEIRREALLTLACCPETGAARKVLEVLEGNDEPLQARLLLRLLEVSANPSVFVEFRRDAARNGRLLRVLQKQAQSTDPAFRWKAAALLANPYALGREVPQGDVALFEEALVSAPEPARPDERDQLFCQLRGAIGRGSEKIRRRVEAMAHHDSAQIRASAAVVYGHSAGGTERRRDVQDSLRLLEDRDPLVRGAAASTLGTIYSTSASERYIEGWADVRGSLQRQLKEEPDPAVRRAIGDALKEGGP
jgi:hypothetical protein